jgi:serine/threonine protein phosphatase PrpC
MTRAIGDIVCQSLGVIAEPDIQLIELSNADKFLMLCSDGVWEFISSEEAISLFKSEEGSLETKVKGLVEASFNQWLEKEKDVSDDITAIVYYFK